MSCALSTFIMLLLKNFDFNYKRNDYVVRAKEAGFSCENVTQNYKMVYEDILKQKEEL